MSHLAAALATDYTEQHRAGKVHSNNLISKAAFHDFDK